MVGSEWRFNKMKTEKVHSKTRAVCPSCREIVNASIVEMEGKIYIKKNCVVHGVSYALTCSDADWYQESTNYVKPGQSPLGLSIKEYKNCPDSCGLCPEHQQHTCLPVIEILSGCDMDCPICLKDFDKSFQMTKDEFRDILRRLKAYEKDLSVINLSGGEPTLHPELEEFLKIAAQENINQVTVSTNGVQLLKHKRLRQVFRETGSIASLQFDGFQPRTYELLRGENLLDQKKEIMAALEEDGVKYSLVATVAKNINDHEITDIVDFFFSSKALSLMFQPATFTGRAASNDFDPDTLRITIPDLVKEIEKNENVKKGDFNPIPCSHYSCFAVSYYLMSKGDPADSRKELAPDGVRFSMQTPLGSATPSPNMATGVDAFLMHPEGNVPSMQVNFNSPEQRGHRNAVDSPNLSGSDLTNEEPTPSELDDFTGISETDTIEDEVSPISPDDNVLDAFSKYLQKLPDSLTPSERDK
jgi:uncharacterized radical SAM superfamily Fe-S cluster-containing enzyme